MQILLKARLWRPSRNIISQVHWKIPSPSFSRSFYSQHCVHFKHSRFLSPKVAYLQEENSGRWGSMKFPNIRRQERKDAIRTRLRQEFSCPVGGRYHDLVEIVHIHQNCWRIFCNVQFRHCYCPGLKPGSLFLVTQRRSQCSRPSCRCSRPQRRRPL